MAMKIDGNRPAGDADATQRVTTPGAAARASTDKASATRGDRLEVSRDTQLLTAALKAVDEAPAVRPDVVERMRKLLEAGELGTNGAKLADAMIDHLLNK